MWTAMESVQFEAGRTDLQSKCVDKIARLAAWASENPDVVIGLDGQRDDPAAHGNDPALSARRVVAVRDALIARGVAPARIVVGEFGTRQFVCRDNTENCLALSRRVDVHAARR